MRLRQGVCDFGFAMGGQNSGRLFEWGEPADVTWLHVCYDYDLFFPGFFFLAGYLWEQANLFFSFFLSVFWFLE